MRFVRPVPVLLAVAGAVVAALLATAAPASAWSYGTNTVDPRAVAPAVGHGPGWVALSYKANGPIVGYLVAPGFGFADGAAAPASNPDTMDIRDTGDASAGSADIDRWPWGWAGGAFRGCAYAYGTDPFVLRDRDRFVSTSCANGPQVRGSSNRDGSPDALRWWHSEDVFCTANGTDRLCSPYGVWSTNKGDEPDGLPTTARTACPAWANIGSAAAYGGGGGSPAGSLGAVPAGASVDVRYVTRDRAWVMGKWTGHDLTAGTHWAFLPRSCLNP